VPFRSQQHDAQRVRQLVDAVVADASRAPGIDAAAAVAGLGFRKAVSVTVPERPFTPQAQGEFAHVVSATADALDALDLAVRAGRGFDARDDAGGAVTVVNQALARRLFGGESAAVGRELLVKPFAGRVSFEQRNVTALTVVGVTADSTVDRQGRADSVIYRPFAQSYDPDVVFIARSSSLDAGAGVAILRTAVRRADQDLAMRYAGGAETFFQVQAITIGIASAAIGTLAAIALVLAMAGLYGVLSHVVFHRTREIGVRMALGASAGRIIRLVIRDGTRPVAEGLFIGLGAAALIRLIIQSSLTQTISAFDPVATAIAVVPLLVAAGISCYLPARRAARVDPNVALKEM
jgi:hypothetical protein